MKRFLIAASIALLSLAFAGLTPVHAGDTGPTGSTTTPVMRLDRLERLADHLAGKVKPAQFDMRAWSNGDDPDSPNYLACAAGHATTIFADEGFRMDVLRDSGLTACASFFGIDFNTAQILFGGTQRSLAREVIEIRTVVAAERVRLARLDPPGSVGAICYLAGW